MCIDWIKSKICGNNNQPQKIPAPSPLKDISHSEVLTLLQAEFPNAYVILTDAKYKTTTKKEIERYLKEDITDEYKYISEYFDCDDFSHRLMGNLHNPDWGHLTFGIVHTKVPNGAHAVNIFISDQNKVYLIEPQNDKIFKCPSDWEPYFILM